MGSSAGLASILPLLMAFASSDWFEHVLLGKAVVPWRPSPYRGDNGTATFDNASVFKGSMEVSLIFDSAPRYPCRGSNPELAATLAAGAPTLD